MDIRSDPDATEMQVEELDERDLLSNGVLPVWWTSESRSPTAATSPHAYSSTRMEEAVAAEEATRKVQRHTAAAVALVCNESQNGNLSSSLKSKTASTRPNHRGATGINGTATASAAERDASKEADSAAEAEAEDDNDASINSLHTMVRPARTSGFATLRAPRDVFIACSLVREGGIIGRYSNSFTLQSEGPKSVRYRLMFFKFHC